MLKHEVPGQTSLAVPRLRLCASTAGGMGSIPGGEAKIPGFLPRSLRVTPSMPLVFCVITEAVAAVAQPHGQIRITWVATPSDSVCWRGSCTRT